MKCYNGRVGMIVLATVVLCLILIGCTVSKSVEGSLDTIGYISDEVSDAGKRGWITNETEDELQDKLYNLTVVIQLPYEPGSVADCGEAKTKNECVDQVLRYVEDKLREGDQ